MSGNSSNKNPKTNTESRFTLVENYQKCLAVLDEIVRDVEAAGESACESDWPDLFQTYLKARQIVRDTVRAEPLIVDSPDRGDDDDVQAEEGRDRRRGLYGPEYQGEMF